MGLKYILTDDYQPMRKKLTLGLGLERDYYSELANGELSR